MSTPSSSSQHSALKTRETDRSPSAINTWMGHILSIIAGACIPLSLAPFNYWWMGLIAIIGYGLLHPKPSTAQDTDKQTTRYHYSPFWRGWYFGLGLYGVGVSWVYVSIHDYGFVPAPIALLMTLAFAAGLALLTGIQSAVYCRWVLPKAYGLLLGLPSVWVLFEWLRSWFLTGFPWLYIGDAHVETWLSAWAPIFGILGISLLISLQAAIICTIVSRLKSGTQIRSTQWFAAISVLLGIWLSGWVAQKTEWTEPWGEPLKVSALQGNIPQEQKWLPEMQAPTLERYRDLSISVWDSDLIIWPETAIPLFYHEALDFINNIDLEAKQQGNAVIVGMPTYTTDATGEGQYHNALRALGNGSGLYYKQHLVPFGEYLPLYSVLGELVNFLDMPVSNFSAGSIDQALLQVEQSDGNYKLAPFICFEIVFPELVRQYGKEADIFFTVSNDGWFGSSIGPHQHFDTARMRALENGRYLVRATNTGITAIINHKGQVIERLAQFEVGAITGNVMRMEGHTPFSDWGLWPVVLLCLILVLSIQVAGKRSKAVEQLSE